MRRLVRLLLYGGTVVAVLGLGKLHAVRHHYDYTGSSRFAWSVAFIVALCLAAYGVGFPDLLRTRRRAAAAAVGAGLSAAVGMGLLELLAGTALLPRFVLFGGAGLLVPWYTGCAILSSGGRSRAEERDRVVVVAEPEEAAGLRDDLLRTPERHAQLVCALTADEAHSATPTSKPLVEELLGARATVVVLARSAQNDESVVRQAATLHEAGVRVRTLSLFYEQWLGKLPVSELERVSLMFDIGELHGPRYARLKRFLDVLAGTAGLVVLAVLTPFVAVGNLVANRGPLLYRQSRVGKNGRPFDILKLRTMRDGAVEASTAWTSEDDPRITRFGHLLRRTHVDELPQVVNILRGDLAVVGPRPEQPHYVAELRAKIPFYDLRHLVRPGLTGWAQVKYGYAGNDADALEKLQYEFYYLRHQSLPLDLRVIGRTIRSVVGRGGR